jgi:hypothetical protein
VSLVRNDLKSIIVRKFYIIETNSVEQCFLAQLLRKFSVVCETLNSKVHNRVYNSPPLDSVRNQLILVHTLMTVTFSQYLLEITQVRYREIQCTLALCLSAGLVRRWSCVGILVKPEMLLFHGLYRYIHFEDLLLSYACIISGPCSL